METGDPHDRVLRRRQSLSAAHGLEFPGEALAEQLYEEVRLASDPVAP